MAEDAEVIAALKAANDFLTEELRRTHRECRDLVLARQRDREQWAAETGRNG